MCRYLYLWSASHSTAQIIQFSIERISSEVIFQFACSASFNPIQNIIYLNIGVDALLLVVHDEGVLSIDMQNDYQLTGNWSSPEPLTFQPYPIPSVVTANNTILIVGAHEASSIRFFSLDIMHNLTETGNISAQIGNDFQTVACAFTLPDTNTVAYLLFTPNCTLSLLTLNVIDIPQNSNASVVIQNITQNPWCYETKSTIECKLFLAETTVAIYNTYSDTNQEKEYAVYVDTHTLISYTVEWQKYLASELVLGFSDSDTVHTSACVTQSDTRLCSVATLNTTTSTEIARTFVATKPFVFQSDTVFSDVDNVAWLLSQAQGSSHLMEIVKANLSSPYHVALATVSFIDPTEVYEFALESDKRTLSIHTINATFLFDSHSLGLLEQVSANLSSQYTYLTSDNNGSAYYLDVYFDPSPAIRIFYYLNGTAGPMQVMTDVAIYDQSNCIATLSSLFVYFMADSVLLVLDRWTLEVVNSSELSIYSDILDMAISHSEDTLYLVLLDSTANIFVTIVDLNTVTTTTSQFWALSDTRAMNALIYHLSDMYIEVLFSHGLLVKVKLCVLARVHACQCQCQCW